MLRSSLAITLPLSLTVLTPWLTPQFPVWLGMEMGQGPGIADAKVGACLAPALLRDIYRPYNYLPLVKEAKGSCCASRAG